MSICSFSLKKLQKFFIWNASRALVSFLSFLSLLNRFQLMLFPDSTSLQSSSIHLSFFGRLRFWYSLLKGLGPLKLSFVICSVHSTKQMSQWTDNFVAKTKFLILSYRELWVLDVFPSYGLSQAEKNLKIFIDHKLQNGEGILKKNPKNTQI